MDAMQKVLAILKAVMVIGFYGSVLVRIENGKVVHIKKEETIKF